MISINMENITNKDSILLNYKDNVLHIGEKWKKKDIDGQYITYTNTIKDYEKIKLALQICCINNDVQSFKIVKFHKYPERTQKQEVSISEFDISNIDKFLSIIKELNLSGLKKDKISLNDIDNFDIGKKELKQILEKKDTIDIILKENLIKDDLINVINLKAKKATLHQFKKMIDENETEPKFQVFF